MLVPQVTDFNCKHAQLLSCGGGVHLALFPVSSEQIRIAVTMQCACVVHNNENAHVCWGGGGGGGGGGNGEQTWYEVSSWIQLD